MAERFPRQNLNPSASPWAREVERRIVTAESGRVQAEQRLDSANRILAAIKGREPADGLHFRGPWESQTQSTDIPWIWGGYLNAMDFDGLSPRDHIVSDGHTGLVTFYPYDQDYDQHDPPTMYFEVRCTYTNPVDYPYDIKDSPYLRAFGPSSAVYEGEQVTEFNEGISDALTSRVYGEFTAGTHEMVATAQGTVNSYGTTGIVFDGAGYKGAPVTWTKLIVKRIDFDGTPNVFIPGQRAKKGVDTTTGATLYHPGDLVTFGGATWLAVAETDLTDLGPGISDAWINLVGSAADAFAGEWSP